MAGPEFFSAVKEFGFPIVLLFIVGVALWKGGKWFGKSVAEPIVVVRILFALPASFLCSRNHTTGCIGSLTPCSTPWLVFFL